MICECSKVSLLVFWLTRSFILLRPVALPPLKDLKEVGGDFDVIFQSKGIPN